MVKASIIQDELDGRAMFRGRRPDTTATNLDDTFVTLA